MAKPVDTKTRPLKTTEVKAGSRPQSGYQVAGVLPKKGKLTPWLTNPPADHEPTQYVPPED